MSSPPVIPISSNQQQPIATSAFRTFIGRLYDSLRNGFAKRRPWYELLDRSAFSRPDSASTAIARVRRNFSYFRVNYMSLLAAVLAFSLLSHPFCLFILLSLLASWLFLYIFRTSDSPPLIVFGRQFSDRETLAGLVLLTVIVVFLTSVGSLLISALMIGLAIVCAHGAFRVPEDLFLDEQEPAAGGFLSFLGGAASSAAAAAAAAATPVAARV